MNITIRTTKDEPLIHSLRHSETERFQSNIVTKVELYSYSGNVYDLETENGTFQAGVGNIIVHKIDSFVYHIEKEGYSKDIEDDVYKWFDASAYKHSKGGIKLNVNLKVIGKFKDKTSDKALSHSVALRSKLYSYYCDDDLTSTVNKVKSVKKCVVKNEIKFMDLYNTLVTQKQPKRNITRLHHKNHETYTIN